MTHRAYLDIETTGLIPHCHELTVVGLCIESGAQIEFVQLVGEEITSKKLKQHLARAGSLYTYNGKRFDLPFIEMKLGIGLHKRITHIDLMFECWKNNLYGGFKRVEEQLGIERKLKGVDGYMAVQLWYRYKNHDDKDALAKLLEYNKEDVLNLAKLRRKLGIA